MIKSAKVLLYYLSLLVLLTNCNKEFDEYYARPDTLADPIYQQLEERGNFTNFLACIEKAGYKHTLSSTGYWTIFAPTDAAFQEFFTERGLAGIDAVDAEMARQIVAYSLVYNAFDKSRLGDFQSPSGWEENMSYKRRTAYYTGSYKVSNTKVGPQEIEVVASNSHGFNYVVTDNNNKYIPVFTDKYFNFHRLTPEDYTTFYPGKTFTGFNVAGAAVVGNEHSIRAENGMIHIIDKVILPLPSIDEHLLSKPEYSDFRALMEQYGANYEVNPLATEKWNKIRGNSAPVYLKMFDPSLAFNPGNENFSAPGISLGINAGQADSWTMFAPTNAVLNNYIRTVLLEHYGNDLNRLNELHPRIIFDFLNAHMWQTTVWPSKFSTSNFVGEPARFNLATDVVEPKALSNGMFYGVNKVQRSDAFHSVFGRVYLDPKYSLMSTFLQRELRLAISNPHVRYTMFALSDAALNEAGYTFDSPTNTWNYMGSSNQAVNRMERLMDLHVAITMNSELGDLSGEGIHSTYSGELIKFKNNRVYAAGNLEPDPQAALNSDNLPQVTATKETDNGVVYYIDKPILFPANAIGLHMQHYPQFSKYFNYLNNSPIYNRVTGEIAGIATGTFYTYFIPSNEAMDKAVADGYLPADPLTTNLDAREKINNFLIYHILNRFSIIPNGLEEGRLESVYKTITADVTHLTVENDPGMIKVTDMAGRTANVVIPNSNIIANRSVMHQIDNYLKYSN